MITFITEKIFIKEVFARLCDSLINNHLWYTINMLFDECIDLLRTVPIVTNLNRMAIVNKMNASPLTCVISIDIEDLNIACIRGRLLEDLIDEWIQKVETF